MDRARVIAPSVSLAAHVCGATFLVLGLIVLPDRLPAPSHGGLETLAVPHSVAVSLGGGGPLRAGPRAAASRPAAARPALVAPPETPTPIDGAPRDVAADGVGVVGLPDGLEGDGSDVGLCLVNCGRGDGQVAGAAVLPSLGVRSAPVRVRQGGDLREPVKVRHVAPEYPPLAVIARVEGRVVLDCVIDEGGRVTAVTVLKSHPLLEAAAVEAVRQWRYRPSLLNGSPVSVLLTVTVDFRLR